MAGFQAAQSGGTPPKPPTHDRNGVPWDAEGQWGMSDPPVYLGPLQPIFTKPFQSPYSMHQQGQEPVPFEPPPQNGWGNLGIPDDFGGGMPGTWGPPPYLAGPASGVPIGGPNGGFSGPVDTKGPRSNTQGPPEGQALGGWDKFKQWYGSPQGRDSMMAGAIFGLSFTNPQAALQMAMQFREQQQNRAFRAEEAQLQREALLERKKLEIELSREQKMQARINALMARASRNEVDPTPFFRLPGNEGGLDASNADAFDLWEAEQNASQEAAEKKEQMRRMWMDQVYTGRLSPATAKKKFPEFAADIDMITEEVGKNKALSMKIKEAQLHKIKATTSAIEKLTPAQKQAVDDAKRQLTEIDDNLKLLEADLNDPAELIKRSTAAALAGESVEPGAIREALRQQMEELIKMRSTLTSVTYEQSKGVGKNPADLTPEGVDARQFFQENPEVEKMIKALPKGSTVKIPGAAVPKMTDKQKDMRRALGLPVD